jgi:hypothetical protein
MYIEPGNNTFTEKHVKIEQPEGRGMALMV